MNRLKKMLCLTLLAGLGIFLADFEEGGGGGFVVKEKYEDRRKRDRVPNIGDVLLSRDGEWLLGFTEFLRYREVRYWLIVSDGDSCFADFIQEPPRQDLLLVRFNGTTQTMVTEGKVKVADYPEDHFRRVDLWRDINEAFCKDGRKGEWCYLLILVEITAEEALGSGQHDC